MVELSHFSPISKVFNIKLAIVFFQLNTVFHYCHTKIPTQRLARNSIETTFSSPSYQENHLSPSALYVNSQCCVHSMYNISGLRGSIVLRCQVGLQTYALKAASSGRMRKGSNPCYSFSSVGLTQTPLRPPMHPEASLNSLMCDLDSIHQRVVKDR